MICNSVEESSGTDHCQIYSVRPFSKLHFKYGIAIIINVIVVTCFAYKNEVDASFLIHDHGTIKSLYRHHRASEKLFLDTKKEKDKYPVPAINIHQESPEIQDHSQNNTNCISNSSKHYDDLTDIPHIVKSLGDDAANPKLSIAQEQYFRTQAELTNKRLASFSSSRNFNFSKISTHYQINKLYQGRFYKHGFNKKFQKREISRSLPNFINDSWNGTPSAETFTTDVFLRKPTNTYLNSTLHTFKNHLIEDDFTPMRTKRIQGVPNVIYIHGLFEKSGRDCRTQLHAGPYELLAAKLAIKHINEGDIIPGYQLAMYENDTMCDSGVAVDSFFHYLYRLPTMLMMLGTGSSEVTERLARVVSRWNIIQVSYGASSPALSDRKNFPFFFRTFAPDSSRISALLAFIQYHKWDTVATIHEHGDNHALPMTKLVTELEQANISVSLTKGVSEKDYKEHLQELKDQDCRILIGSFSLNLVRKIFCHVFKLQMFGAEYAWILQMDLKETWWADSTGTECTKSQLTAASLGVIVAGSHYGLEGNSTSVSGITLDNVLLSIGFKTDPKNSGFVSQTYDAVWTMALALKKAQAIWNEEERNISLADFSYDDYEMAEEIAVILSRLKFTGVSGPVSFYNSDRVGITSFHQNQGDDVKFSLVCLHYPQPDELNFDCEECVNIIWQGNKVPIARRIIRLRVAVLDRSVLISVTSLASFGVLLALIFLSFNLYFRRLKFIKLSSPNLNNFVVVGCILVYVAMILLGMDHGSLSSDSHFGFICSARAFLLSGGFSLAFGCMFIKMYRVYHIFIRSNSGIVKSKLLHDKQLLALVGVLVLVDCFVVTLWVTLDPMERQLRNLTMQVNPLERNVVYLYQREQCYSAHMAKWLGSLYIYKGLLLVVGCYMAWETRHVKIPALNDSQYIGMSVYNVVITSVIVVALANVIPVDRYRLTFVLVSTLIFVSTTMTLCLLFLPKIHTILTDSGEGEAVVATPGVKVEFRTRRFALDESRESMYRAEVLNRALKRELLELEEELSRLSEKMGIIPSDMQKSKMNEPKHQDEDSDDDLPPWLDEYRKYPPNGDRGVWYTVDRSRPGACFSMLSAMHPLFMSTAECPSSKNKEMKRTPTPPLKVSKHSRNDKPLSIPDEESSTDLRSSLPTIIALDSSNKNRRSEIESKSSISVSDKALNRIKYPRKSLQTDTTRESLRCVPLKSKQYSKSTTRLLNDCNKCEMSYMGRPTASLPKISAVDRSHSIISGNTMSCGSEWTTAPLCSSSFATARESMGFSSTNPTLVTACDTPDPQRLPRDSLTDSSNGFFPSDDSYGNNEQLEPNLALPTSSGEIPKDYKNNFSNSTPKLEDIDNQRTTDSRNKTEIHIFFKTEDSDVNLSSLTSSLEYSNYTNCDDTTVSIPCSPQSDTNGGVGVFIEEENDISINESTCLLEMSENSNILVETEPTLQEEPSIMNTNIYSYLVDCPSRSTEIDPVSSNKNSTSRNSQNTRDIEENANTQTIHYGDGAQDFIDTVEKFDILGSNNDKNDPPELDQTDKDSGSQMTNEHSTNENQDQRNYENLRHIFQLERDLILLELEQSESVDI